MEEGKYIRQILEELGCRCPELDYDLNIIAEKLEAQEWEPMSDDDKSEIRKYFESKAHLGSFKNRDIEEAIQDTIKYNEPSFIHKRSISELIERVVDWNESPQGKAYLKWLFFKYFPEHSVWQHPDHDLDLPLNEARLKYQGLNDLPWLARGQYLPPMKILARPPLDWKHKSNDKSDEISGLLVQNLTKLNIQCKIIDEKAGPVLTTVKLQMVSEFRASKVRSHSEDIAKALSVESIRVIDCQKYSDSYRNDSEFIDVEVPNKVRETVYLKEILESDNFKKQNHPMAVALGSDTIGNPISINLSKMPHILMSGTTGSGKSVLANSMICSILFNTSPEQVRFLMIDPKMLELSIYEGIPHQGLVKV